MKSSQKSAIRLRLEELAIENKGRLTPLLVLADAKHPRSPLHGSFTWDNIKAAGQHRIEQARELIRSIRIEVRTETHFVSVPRYVHDPRVGNNQGYAEITAMRSQKDLARESLQYELDRAYGALERAQEIATVLGLQGDLARFLNDLRAFKENYSPKKAA